MRAILPMLLLLAVAPRLSAQARFTDNSTTTGIANTGQNRGVSVVDYNNDGLEDLYFSRLDEPNLLYRNNGNGTFTDVAAAAGVAYPGISMCTAWGDLDNDGRIDMVLGNQREATRVYRNNGDGTFTDITTQTGISNNGKTQAVLLADYDNDGLLDIYLANFNDQNALYRNLGGMKFGDFVYAAGASDTGLAMGSIFFDYDNDGDQDLYLTHDGNQPNILYRNNGNGTFTDVSVAAGVNYAANGMGVDAGDFDNDGYLDLYITNLRENVLFRNNGDGTFTNVTAAAGVGDRGMGWGTVWLDCDNDGRQDLYVSNETPFRIDGVAYPNILYRNEGDGTFSDVSRGTPLASTLGGFATAAFDANLDGRPDLVVANSGAGGNQLFLNGEETPYHYLVLQLEGTVSNRSAIGTRVVIEADGRQWTDQVNAGSGFAGQNSPRLHFGLGMVEVAEKITIYWPSGTVETFKDVAADQVYHITEGTSITTPVRQPVVEALSLRIAPNPVSGQLRMIIDLKETSEEVSLRLWDVQGRLVAQRALNALPAGEQMLEWPVDIRAGLYLIEVKTARGVGIQRVIKL